MLARVPAVSCLPGWRHWVVGTLYHLLGLAKLGKLHLLTSKKSPELVGRHVSDKCHE